MVAACFDQHRWPLELIRIVNNIGFVRIDLDQRCKLGWTLGENPWLWQKITTSHGVVLAQGLHGDRVEPMFQNYHTTISPNISWTGLTVLLSLIYPGIFMLQESYKMSSNPRGRAVIMNNKFFKVCTTRNHSEKDVQRLSRLFQQLHFEVEVWQDCTREVIHY